MEIIINGHQLPVVRERTTFRRRIASSIRAIALLLISVAITGAIVAAMLVDTLAAPALAAPSGARSAQDTVNTLQADGFKVIVSRTGSAPLDQCTVGAIRPGRQVTRINGSGDDVVREVLYTTVYLDATC